MAIRVAPSRCWQHGEVLLLTSLILWAGCGKTAVNRSQPDPESDTPTSRDASAESTVDPITAATRALAQNDLEGAEASIRRRLLEDPNDPRALELSGDIATRRRDAGTSIQMYGAAVDASDLPSEALLDKLAVQYAVAGRAYDTLDVLEKRIELYPRTVSVRQEYAGLASVLGVASAAVPPLRWLAQHGHGDAEAWPFLANPRRVEADGEYCTTLLNRNPADLRPNFGLASLDARKLKWTGVPERLNPVMEQHPDFVPAFILYGQALIELNRYDEVPEWNERVPDQAKSTADYWLIVGRWAQHQGQHPQAARAFWEAVRLDDVGYPEALSGLLNNLKQMGREQEAELVATQLQKRVTAREALKKFHERKSMSQQAALRVADVMVEMGRLWEAEGWARLAAGLPRDRVPDIRERYLAIRSKLTTDTPWQREDLATGSGLDLSDLPMPDWTSTQVTSSIATTKASGVYSFQDQAQQRGLIHTCEVDPQAEIDGHWIYQSVGGGVAIIDFDLDGWPDLAAAMLNGKPLHSDSLPNRLFRNLQGEFVRCGVQANYQDRGFAQGIAIGDFNDDGFPDILDANIGQNRLYKNNGDGTFDEVSDQAGINDEVWTSSAVIVDIDGDHVADIYQVSYCAGGRTYERPCRNKKTGKLSTCSPLTLEAEKDRVWRGTGDGSFEDVTEKWMNPETPGRGLGVVAGHFDEHPGLDLYVANDMTVNHLWSGQHQGQQQNEEFALIDLAAIRGLGLSGRAQSQASMGMAAGDPDQDGDIDFLLTHFSGDHNTYYEQVAPGLWSDRSYPVGLAEPSMNMLGFGTEWVDLDNNGTSELIIANGHIDDLKLPDLAYRMPAQLFELDGGRWKQPERSSLGEYFSGEHLGRALATVDADRDGLVDVVITHLYEPVALLINQTTGAGRSIGLELKSTSGQRDAIGSRISARIGTREIKAQLTAGDGFMVSNQRRIHFGAGDVSEATNVVVTWPSGKSEEFGTLAVGADYLLVEGSAQAFEMATHQ